MWSFRAMNTDVTVIADGDDESRVVNAISNVFADAEARFSRFREDSELSRINRARNAMVVSAPMFDALSTARRYVELTGGLFDPAIGGALASLGYDRSFAPGALDRDGDEAVAPAAASFLAVELDAARRTVKRPANIQLDLGGMIKGRTVDQAAAHLPPRGAIDAGGDMVVRGGGTRGWRIHIEDPRDSSRTIATLRVRDGAVATSAANRRRWRVARSLRHHLVDPRTQRSAVTDVLQATVVAPTAERADVLAKTVFLLGVDRARDFIASSDVGAVLINTQGEVITCGSVDLVSS
jgi:thiamine biosynthesis lipoprotein